MKKRKPLKLFTKTWPPKDTKEEEELERPLTATLEKPTILNISFIDKIDMTLMRKEFFALSNLCKLPLTINLKKTQKQPQAIHRKPTRPLSLPSSEIKHKHTQHNSRSEDELSLKSTRKLVAPLKRQSPKICEKALSDTNNNTKSSRKLPPTTKLSYVKSTKLPEPCKTCGRSDQPERLHSHPVTSVKSVKRTMEESKKTPIKNTVQKPVAIKYQSKKTVSPTKKAPTPPQPKKLENKQKQDESVVRPKSGKRTLTCYLCSREFGTASLSLHEPKCLEVRILA